jgi:hypothetical protein
VHPLSKSILVANKHTRDVRLRLRQRFTSTVLSNSPSYESQGNILFESALARLAYAYSNLFMTAILTILSPNYTFSVTDDIKARNYSWLLKSCDTSLFYDLQNPFSGIFCGYAPSFAFSEVIALWKSDTTIWILRFKSRYFHFRPSYG